MKKPLDIRLQEGDTAVMVFKNGRFQLQINYVTDWGDIQTRPATMDERAFYARAISQMVNGSYI